MGDSVKTTDITIGIGRDIHVQGILSEPLDARASVIFAHGSGSSRLSPRNNYVANVLNEAGFCTFLFDLLTDEEAIVDEKTKEFRFDIALLADRLTAVTNWVLDLPRQKAADALPLGYFGASTGAAAALAAASAQRNSTVKAIISRGGRVDLAASSLKHIHKDTAILFLVGSNDPPTIKWNENVMKQLKHVVNKRLVLVQGAGHLFEEQGKLQEVAKHAASWFESYL